MEVYPAVREGGRGKKEKERRRRWRAEAGSQAEESPVEPAALWYRLGSRGVVRQVAEEGCELRKEGEGGVVKNQTRSPFSDYRHGAALDVHWGLNRKMDFFKKLLNT